MAEIKAWPEQSIASTHLQRRKTGFHEPAKRASGSQAALEELFILLENYAPAWYTQEHHDRALAAILQKER